MSRVLHIVEGGNDQATERWLSSLVYESVSRGDPVAWSFYCTNAASAPFAARMREAGCEVLVSPYTLVENLKFLSALRLAIKAGQYDIIHSHHDIMSGFYFLATIGLPRVKRVVHIHNTSCSIPTLGIFKRFVGRIIFWYSCRWLADLTIGASVPALNSLSGTNTNRLKYCVVHCGIHLGDALHNDLFNETKSLNDPADVRTSRRHGLLTEVSLKGALDVHQSAEKSVVSLSGVVAPDAAKRADVRRALEVSESAVVLLFVGRMIEYKNPTFVVEIIAELRQRDASVYGVFSGLGAMREDVIKLAQQRGVADRVRCLGWRDDIKDLMIACDVLIFPSLESPMEGLGLGVIEAQSWGLPVIMSLSVPDEAIIIPELVTAVPLQAGARAWGEKALSAARRRDAPRNYHECQDVISRSSFAAYHSLSSLKIRYRDIRMDDADRCENLPNFLVIGSSKCGTASLQAYISKHPEIYLPIEKELHFFQEDDASWGTWRRGREWYSSKFTGTSAYLARGECSPGYSHEDQAATAAKKIFSMLPRVKIVYMIRKPLDRIRSHYVEEVENGHLPSTITLNDIISSGPSGHSVASHFFRVIVQSTLYARQLGRYLHYFPQSNIHLIVFEELVVNPVVELRKLFQFLGVYENFIPPNLNKIYNSGMDKRITVYNPTAALKMFPFYDKISRVASKRLRRQYRMTINEPTDTGSTEISPENIGLLDELFRDDISQLSKSLGRDFSDWQL
jgi:glycosyltransferase involved in cell wall biosynthesis